MDEFHVFLKILPTLCSIFDFGVVINNVFNSGISKAS